MKVEIPPIYEEDIIEFVQREENATFKYFNEDKIVKITFFCVYAFDFVEFEYINEMGWVFGLELQNNSAYIERMVSNMTEEKKQRAFGGEYKKIKHYKLVIDDVGMYNIICKDIDVSFVSV